MVSSRHRLCLQTAKGLHASEKAVFSPAKHHSLGLEE